MDFENPGLGNKKIFTYAGKLWSMGKGSTARKGYLSLIDQALLSGTNFITALVLARYTGKTEFGAYVLAFSALLFINGLQNALLTGPMTILGAPREGDDLKRYVSTLAVLQMEGGALLALLALAVVGVMAYAEVSPELKGAFLGMAGAVFFVQSQEFCRRFFFTKLLVRKVFFNDAIFCLLKLAGLYALWKLDAGGNSYNTGSWLTSRNVFFLIAVSALAASIVGLFQLREFLVTKLKVYRAYILENWSFGKWVLGGFIGSSLLIHANNFIVAAFAGIAGAAMLEAPRLILAPLQVLTFAGQNVLTPKAADKYGKSGKKGLIDFLRPVVVLWGIFFLCYALVIALAPDFWLKLFYGARYEGAGGILILWAAVYAVMGLYVMQNTVLLVLRRTDLLMYVRLAAGTLVLVFSAWLSARYGANGAAGARLIGEIALLILTVFLSFRILGLNLRGKVQDNED